MKLIVLKMKLLGYNVDLRIAHFAGNAIAGQHALENITILRTGLRVLEERTINELLFNR